MELALTEKNLRGFPARSCARRDCGRRFVRALRLCRGVTGHDNSSVPSSQLASVHTTVQTVVHRFEETIGGRTYHIEVAPVDAHRWRAYIVRVPGVPTALMPFYGATPDQAAASLLRMAHARARQSGVQRQTRRRA